MTTLSDAALFACDSAAQTPITAGIVAAAVSILNESADQPHHAQRTALAVRVMENPEYLTNSFAWAVSTNGTTVGKWVSGDRAGAINDFAYVISTVWDSVAGVAAQ